MINVNPCCNQKVNIFEKGNIKKANHYPSIIVTKISNGEFDDEIVNIFRSSQIDLKRNTTACNWMALNSCYRNLALKLGLDSSDNHIVRELYTLIMYNKRFIRDRIILIHPVTEDSSVLKISRINLFETKGKFQLPSAKILFNPSTCIIPTIQDPISKTYVSLKENEENFIPKNISKQSSINTKDVFENTYAPDPNSNKTNDVLERYSITLRHSSRKSLTLSFAPDPSSLNPKSVSDRDLLNPDAIPDPSSFNLKSASDRDLLNPGDIPYPVNLNIKSSSDKNSLNPYDLELNPLDPKSISKPISLVPASERINLDPYSDEKTTGLPNKKDKENDKQTMKDLKSVNWSRTSEKRFCPRCHHNGQTKVQYRIGCYTMIWVLGLLCTVICMPCFWFPLIMPFSKDALHICRKCNFILGKVVGKPKCYNKTNNEENEFKDSAGDILRREL